MNKAKAFFYCCGGAFLLALAFHLGAMTATAQAPGNPVVAAISGNTGSQNYQVAVFTANGDVYGVYNVEQPWTRLRNVFLGPTPAAQPTWGQIKSRYRPGAAAAPQDK